MFPAPMDGYVCKNALVETYMEGTPLNTLLINPPMGEVGKNLFRYYWYMIKSNQVVACLFACLLACLFACLLVCLLVCLIAKLILWVLFYLMLWCVMWCVMWCGV